LLQTLANDPEKRMEQIVEEAYDVTLKPWHGWISSTAFRVTPTFFFPFFKQFSAW